MTAAEFSPCSTMLPAGAGTIRVRAPLLQRAALWHTTARASAPRRRALRALVLRLPALQATALRRPTCRDTAALPNDDQRGLTALGPAGPPAAPRYGGPPCTPPRRRAHSMQSALDAGRLEIERLDVQRPDAERLGAERPHAIQSASQQGASMPNTSMPRTSTPGAASASMRNTLDVQLLDADA